MSSFDGYLHERDAKIVLRVLIPASVVIACLSILWPNLWQVAIGIVIGAYGGFAVTPDADHKNMTREEYRAMKKWGILGALLVAYMTPYAYLIPHRSRLSHTIIPGTLIRMTYVLAIPTICIWLLFNSLNWDFPWMVYAGITYGWMQQDVFHYARDGLGLTGRKRKKRKEW